MNGYDPSNLIAAGVVYAFGALSAAAFGNSELVVDLLAGGGLGAIVGQLVVLARARRGIRGRGAEIVAAWTAVGAAMTFVGYVVSELP